MSLCVVDSSFAMAWVFEDERNDLADALLARLGDGDSILVPAVLWALEVRNCLRNGVLRRRLSKQMAELRRRELLALPRVTVTCPNGLADELHELMTGHNLTSYDACYISVAREHGLPLATLDKQLARAATAVGVPRFTGT